MYIYIHTQWLTSSIWCKKVLHLDPAEVEYLFLSRVSWKEGFSKKTQKNVPSNPNLAILQLPMAANPKFPWRKLSDLGPFHCIHETHQPTNTLETYGKNGWSATLVNSWPPWTWSPFQRTRELLSFQMKQQVVGTCCTAAVPTNLSLRSPAQHAGLKRAGYGWKVNVNVYGVWSASMAGLGWNMLHVETIDARVLLSIWSKLQFLCAKVSKAFEARSFPRRTLTHFHIIHPQLVVEHVGTQGLHRLIVFLCQSLKPEGHATWFSDSRNVWRSSSVKALPTRTLEYSLDVAQKRHSFQFPKRESSNLLLSWTSPWLPNLGSSAALLLTPDEDQPRRNSMVAKSPSFSILSGLRYFATFANTMHDVILSPDIRYLVAFWAEHGTYQSENFVECACHEHTFSNGQS